MEYSKEAFLKLYEPVHESFARFCQARAYGVMEPEDLISETVLKALENFTSLRNPEAFLSYLFTIAIYDYDLTSTNDFMGSVNVEMYHDQNGFPISQKVNGSNVAFEVFYEYFW